MIRRLVSEALGTGFLLCAVVGSGIMAETLFPGQTGLALLANALATGTALYTLISLFGPVSGAQFNPVVSLVMALSGRMTAPAALAYALAQVAGAILGVWAAHLMFGLPVWQISDHARDTLPLYFAETLASFGLILTILGGLAHAPERLPTMVACYITAAYWFTASTSFANPAAALARALTNSFAGIAPPALPGFIGAELLGALAAMALGGWLFRKV